MYSSSAGKNSPSLTVFRGPYINLTFQDGPIQEQGVNGTTNEEVIYLLMERLESLNRPPFQSPYNTVALGSLQEALDALEARKAERQKRGVEGTNTP